MTIDPEVGKAPDSLVVWLVQVEPSQILYFRHIIESYEIVANVHTLDKSSGLLETWSTTSLESQLERIIRDLSGELDVKVLQKHAAVSSPG